MSLSLCPYCSTLINDISGVCPECALASGQFVKCYECEAIVPANEAVCPECGAGFPGRKIIMLSPKQIADSKDGDLQGFFSN